MNKGQYDQEYARTHIVRKFIPFNPTVSQDDAKMLSWLSAKPNITQYIKDLIREDIEKKEEESRKMKWFIVD